MYALNPSFGIKMEAQNYVECIEISPWIYVLESVLSVF